MDASTKNRFDAIAQLHVAAWQRFDARRTYEWQVTMAFWTALSISIAGVVNATAMPKVELRTALAVLTIFSLSAVIFQYIFIRGVAKAHSCDKKIAIHFRKSLQEISDTKFSDMLEKELGDPKINWGKTFNWSSLPQIGITILLSTALIIVTCAKIENKITFNMSPESKNNLIGKQEQQKNASASPSKVP